MSEDDFRRMLVLESEIESLKTTLQSYREVFNNIHKRLTNVENGLKGYREGDL